jgi:hypothetical protein
MDIECVIYNDEVLDPSLWTTTHLTIPLSELMPDIRHPETRLTLKEIATSLKLNNLAYARLDLHY